MQEGEIRVWNLLDADEREDIVSLVDEQIAQTQQDLVLAADADARLARVQALLLQMQDLAKQACVPSADRAALHMEFIGLRAQLDTVLAQPPFSAQDAERLASLLSTLERGHFSAPDSLLQN